MHSMEDPEINQMCSEQAKQNDWSKKTPEEKKPIKRMQTTTRARFFESTLMPIHILFFYLINTFLVFTTSVFVKNHFYEARAQGLVTGHSPWWSSGQDSVSSLPQPDLSL